MKFFNTAGPIKPEDHYYIPHRLDEKLVRQLIEQEKYFVLHAPRQSGKTTAITIFTYQLNAEGKYKALYINVEPGQAARNNIKEAMEAILTELQEWALFFLQPDDPLFKILKKELKRITAGSFNNILGQWSRACQQPIILFIDEIDSLIGDTLISVLRQLRSGYSRRPRNFPQAVCLIGVRDVRDYRIWSDEKQAIVLGGSAFNIKAESLVIPNFSPAQVRDLYLQHTKETGQQFTDEAIDCAYYLTQGQPWLVNALAYQACFRDVTDHTQPITKEVLERAKETLILRRDTHIDVLVDRLQEPRVRAIIDAIIAGEGTPEQFPPDDISYVIDLGLITERETRLKIANPIYQEVIPRELSYGTQRSILQEAVWYQNQDKSLNMQKLLNAFTQFYREHSAIWLEKFAYKEAGPHLLLLAFLQRIINGGGKIHREYALGRKRVDLLIEWQKQRIVIELKVKRGDKALAEGLAQTAEYMDINNATEGHLIIFDRTSGKSWDEKIFNKTITQGNQTINVWGV